MKGKQLNYLCSVTVIYTDIHIYIKKTKNIKLELIIYTLIFCTFVAQLVGNSQNVENFCLVSRKERGRCLSAFLHAWDGGVSCTVFSVI